MDKWYTISNSNTHHVQDNENSGHRVAPQEDPQSDAEITEFPIITGDYISHRKTSNYSTVMVRTKNTPVKCYLKRSMVLAALRTLPYIPGLS